MGRKTKLERDGVSHAGNPGYVSVGCDSVASLSSIMSVRVEMAKIYKLARRGILKIHESNQLIYMLSQIVFACRAELEEKKITEESNAKDATQLPEQPDLERIAEILKAGNERYQAERVSIPSLRN